ncbi:transcriptional regulator, AraC family with amidase-like domain [Thalassovita taeanensis]|uniref:Transcriptional regulator, AraC family with amidase-like domain n=1 Tax=Thalassovita taeanensis TaxID=657014 RepID=A0A1H9ENB5_9RHOB|nr:transcriptional regulator, AraC family with amidase-like domain [Thalassovita taeanensis]
MAKSAKNISENIFAPSEQPLSTALLLLDDSNMLSFAAALDPMRAANRRAGKPLFGWSFFSPTGTPARLTSGVTVPAQPIATLDRCDLLIVIAGFRVNEQATPALLASLRRLAPRCHALAGIDGGSWVLAGAGLLNGQRATTHWEDLEDFAARFDQVDLLRDRYVISGKYITSGGAAPAIDLMLHLIGARYGAGLARRVASAFIYDPDPHAATTPQALSGTARLSRRHPLVARAVALMETHIEDPLPIADIASALAVSPRQLEAQFARALAMPPKRFYLDLRLSEARRLAQDTALPVQQIALATGFSSQASLARAFRAGLGLSVRDLRRAHEINRASDGRDAPRSTLPEPHRSAPDRRPPAPAQAAPASSRRKSPRS